MNEKFENLKLPKIEGVEITIDDVKGLKERIQTLERQINILAFFRIFDILK